MLSIGWSEMLVIAAVALIVVGPKDLPAMLRQLGRMMGTLRRMGNDFRAEINKAVAVDEITDIRKSITQPLVTARQEIEREFNKVGPNGTVEPSGKIVPKDPNSESVYEEITAAIAPPGKLNEAPPAVAEAKPAAKPTAKRTRKPAAKSSQSSTQGKSEASKSAKPASARRASTSKSAEAGEKPAAKKPAARKTAARKPAAKKPTARKSTNSSKSADTSAKADQ